MISINNKNSIGNNIKFKAKPLYEVTLRIKKRGFATKLMETLLGENRRRAPLKAFFCEYDRDNKNDVELFLDISRHWKNFEATAIATEFEHNLFNLKPYGIVVANSENEIINAGNLVDKTVSVSMASFPNKESPDFYIHFLSSAPGIANNSESNLRGAGALNIYGVTRAAAENNVEKIKLFSVRKNFKFYEQLGFSQLGTPESQFSYFELCKSNFQQFFEQIRKKYGF